MLVQFLISLYELIFLFFYSFFIDLCSFHIFVHFQHLLFLVDFFILKNLFGLIDL